MVPVLSNLSHKTNREHLHSDLQLQTTSVSKNNYKYFCECYYIKISNLFLIKDTMNKMEKMSQTARKHM